MRYPDKRKPVSQRERRGVRPKKSLGQHFLKDQNIARKIVEALEMEGGSGSVLEIGPGTGVLTKFLLENGDIRLKVIEIDRESVAYLLENYPAIKPMLVEGDFLEVDLDEIFSGHFSIIGNFPYNISSQIFFKVLQFHDRVDQVVCMLQKEVADRMAAPHGNKTYGILSVLLQVYYDVRILFKVPPGVFSPPPKVMSAVVRLKRNDRLALSCDEKMLVEVVKQAFNNRRKTLRNALKNLNLPAEIFALDVFNKRAEQLSVPEFIHLTALIENSRAAN